MINYYTVKVSGKNYNYFLISLFKLGINFFDIKYFDNYITFKVSYSDYKYVKSIKTGCNISIIGTSGIKRFYFLFYKYKLSIISFIFCFSFFYFLSFFTLFINIDTDNNSLRSLIYDELKDYGITVFSFKKSYSSLSHIKNKIKNNNLDKIEWIEIYNKGVYTNVKVIERVKSYNKSSSLLTDVVAGKNGYIKKINSSSGEVLKNIDDYVKKGDVIISGNIFRNDKVIDRVHASGDVYAEVWYIVKCNHSYNYVKDNTGSKGYFKIIFNIFGKDLTVFKIKTDISDVSKKIVFNNNLFSVFFLREFSHYNSYERYSNNELYSFLFKRAKNSILDTLDDGEMILDEKTLKKYKKNDRMYVEIFFKTYENIAVLKDIKKIDDINVKE